MPNYNSKGWKTNQTVALHGTETLDLNISETCYQAVFLWYLIVPSEFSKVYVFFLEV